MSGASISEGFTTTFCSSEDRKVLSNDTIEVWKAGIIGGYKDRSVSIFFFFVNFIHLRITVYFNQQRH